MIRTAKNTMPKNILARPFLKWAGGKTQLAALIEKRLPLELEQGKITSYVEPFVGGGAVFFHLQNKFHFKKVVLCDQNPDLILTYKIVQYHVSDLISELLRMQNRYNKADDKKRQMIFYEIRDKFNRHRLSQSSPNQKQSIARAAMFIFLNKTCFNGLFRLNSKGEYNVPLGRYRNPNICDTERLLKVHHLLQNVVLLTGDYRQTQRRIGSSTFVYFDPPYRPLSATANFTGYTAECFDDKEQTKLSEFFRHCHIKSAKLMLSNSDPKNHNPRDLFFDRLYHDFNIERIPARRFINSRSDRRGAINELLITNYPYKI